MPDPHCNVQQTLLSVFDKISLLLLTGSWIHWKSEEWENAFVVLLYDESK